MSRLSSNGARIYPDILNGPALLVAHGDDAIGKDDRVPLLTAIERKHVPQDELDGLLNAEESCNAPASGAPDLRQDPISQEMMKGRIESKDVSTDITREQ